MPEVSAVSVIGTGLIGGSIGLGLRERSPGARVIGYDADASSAARAVERGVLDAALGSVAEAVADADLVVVAVPLDEMRAVCDEIARHARPRAVVTDVGSAKVAVVREAERLLGGRFVGGHPMAGSERHGIDAAKGSLFEEAWWILTPTAATTPAAYRSAARLATSLGARPIAIDPLEHDRLVARLSHLPQLAASALVRLSAARDDQPLLPLAGGGFRDTTRIAASDPALWLSILRTNRAAVVDALAGMTTSLTEVADMLSHERWDELEAWLRAAQSERVRLFDKPVYGGEPVVLALWVPDQPGVLASVTTAAGEVGANIEDLRIIHSTEGGRGRLELVVARTPELGALIEALKVRGYEVEEADAGAPE